MAKNIKVTVTRRSPQSVGQLTLPASYIQDCGSIQSNKGGLYFTTHKTFPLIAQFTPLIGAGYPVEDVAFRGTFYLVFKASPESRKRVELYTSVQTGSDDGGFYFNTISSTQSPISIQDAAGATLLTAKYAIAEGVTITLENHKEPRFIDKFNP